MSRLLERAREVDLVKGMIVGRGDQQVEISQLFFTDDTFIFCQPKERMLFHLRCILMCFEAVFELNINLKKSELVRIGDRRDKKRLAEVLGCKLVKLPIKYLVVPLGSKDKDTKMWDLVIECLK